MYICRHGWVQPRCRQPRTLVSLNINATIPTWQTTLNTHVVVPTNTTKTHMLMLMLIQESRFVLPADLMKALFPGSRGFVKSGLSSSQRSWTQHHIRSGQTSRAQMKAEYTEVLPSVWTFDILVFFADPDHCTLIPAPFVSPSDSSRGTSRHRRGKIIAKNRELCTRRYCKLLSTSTGSCYIQQSCDAASAPTWLPEVSLWPRPPLHHFRPLRKLLHTDLLPVGRSRLSDSSRANVYKQDDFTADYRLSSS